MNKHVFLFLIACSISPQIFSQRIYNATIYNISPFVKSCCKNLDIDSCLIMIKSDNLVLRYGIQGQTSEVDKGNCYYILVDRSLDFEKTLSALAHELVHVKQLKSGVLRFNHDTIHYFTSTYSIKKRNHSLHVHETDAATKGSMLYEEYRNVPLGDD